MAISRSVYPRTFVGNPYQRRTYLLAGPSLGRLGDEEPGLDPSGAGLDPTFNPATFSSTITAGPDPNGVDPSMTPEAIAADSAFMAKLNAAPAGTMVSSGATPSTPTPPSNSSINWASIITGAAGAVAKIAPAVAQGQASKNAVRAAQAAAAAAAAGKTGLHPMAHHSVMPWIMAGGGAVILVGLFLAFRKH